MNMTISSLSALIAELGTLAGVAVAFFVWFRKIVKGQRCQLRSDMLRIYYHNCESGEIRQYEYENFVMLYEAYKALKGNSFIDKIYEEVRSWEVIT